MTGPRHEAHVCLQLVPVSTDSVTTALTQTVAVNRTLACRASPVCFVTVKRWPAASRLSSVMLMRTVTSAREPSGESSCTRHLCGSGTVANASLNVTVAAGAFWPAGGTVIYTPQPCCVIQSLCSVLRCICKPGYQGDGITCVESDPCAPPHRGGCSLNVRVNRIFQNPKS